ncbi:YfiT family bacillithiol transferase [Paenibacillus sp. FJAT-26967]|uniref:YfiT family bacillithiol transferase n=1 Tax=Paenibacillus sp. FJAT-26967 TaxID=1729690 RepID=UPI0008384C79|nr:bacillithiol transferase BstA [Paenibacillus sp. FJAT-26967]
MEDLKYPIGLFRFEGEFDRQVKDNWIGELASLPVRLRQAATGLSAEQLDTPYRPDGWTVRQVVHHVADSHMNSYIRFKLVATESEPVIKPYLEERWAELADAKSAPVEGSLALLDALHDRWASWLRTLNEPEWEKAFVHPVSGKTTLGTVLGLYAWHGNHHVAHITSLRERMGWS